MSFSAAEISRIAGFSKPWMLNHLEREEIFVPDKSRARQHGRHRGYTFRDLIILRAINRLLELGARPKRIKAAIGTFERVCPDCDTDDRALAFARASGHFVITPSEVFFCAAQEELIDLLRGGQMSFSFMVECKPQIAPAILAGIAINRRRSVNGHVTTAQLERIAQRHKL